MNDFSGRVILLTGASGGLGAAVNDAFLSAGANVVAVARSFDATEDKPRCIEVAADLTSTEGVEKAVAAALEATGKIDALVHVMGGFAGGAPVHETDEATWDTMMNLNLRAAFLVTRAVLRPMLDVGYGRIVAIGSRVGVEPAKGLAAYGASKAGLNALIQTIALEVKGKDITANVVMPSTIDTPANRGAMPKADFSKWVTPESIADQILRLCSPEAGEISGTLIPMYGRS
ncbi:MAG: SDR family NAD(P)-dependent oxidoreductase [Acidobacteria bacterium]|nr:SDR family NAD(P)-dependent oxidoreductase [Acidobacteriota bacterium]